jgi:flagellar FliJ protein
MSTQNLQTLTILLERAEGERDTALAHLQALMQQAEQARGQAEQLGRYRSEYQTRWGQQFARSTTIDIMGCYQNFGQRLDQAITQQGSVTAYADQRVERAAAAVRELEMRVASVRKLLERRRFEMNRALERQDQKATDEQAARASRAAFNPLMRLSA